AMRLREVSQYQPSTRRHPATIVESTSEWCPPIRSVTSMVSANPAFNNPAFQDPRKTQGATVGGQTAYTPPPAVDVATQAKLEGAFAAPPAGARETGRMTIEDTVWKTVGLFAILLVTSVVGWVWTMA